MTNLISREGTLKTVTVRTVERVATRTERTTARVANMVAHRVYNKR